MRGRGRCVDRETTSHERKNAQPVCRGKTNAKGGGNVKEAAAAAVKIGRVRRQKDERVDGRSRQRDRQNVRVGHIHTRTKMKKITAVEVSCWTKRSGNNCRKKAEGAILRISEDYRRNTTAKQTKKTRTKWEPTFWSLCLLRPRPSAAVAAAHSRRARFHQPSGLAMARPLVRRVRAHSEEYLQMK